MIDDFLPYGITIKHGELSNKFYELDYSDILYNDILYTDTFKVNDKQYQYLYSFFKTIIINSNSYNKFSFKSLMNLKYRNIDIIIINASLYWQENDYYRDLLQISVSNHVNDSVKIPIDINTRLLIIYAFLDNQFFPTIDKFLEVYKEQLRKDINTRLKNAKFIKDDISKETFQVIINYSLIVFFIKIITYFFEYINNQIIDIKDIDKIINKFFIPYIYLCDSKYIRMNKEFKDVLYSHFFTYLNYDSINKFLIEYFYNKDVNLNYWKYLKKKLLHKYIVKKEKSTIDYYWEINGYLQNNLRELLLNLNITIKINDYRICISILDLLQEELNNISKLSYILFCYSSYKTYKLQNDINLFLKDLIIKYELTNINSYFDSSFELSKEEIDLIKEQLPKLNEIISK